MPGDRGPAGVQLRAGAGWLRLLPAFLVACGLVLDWFTPPELSAAPFYSAAPMAAATLLSMRATVLTGVCACVADALMGWHFGQLGQHAGLTEIVTIATVSGLAVVVNHLLQRSDLRLRSVRSVAVAVQLAVLPPPPSRIGRFEVAARYEAAQADAQLGGDLYAVQDTAYGLRCVVGDVRGKGMGAVEAVAVVLGAFREAAELEPTIARVTERLERAMEREGLRRASLDRFEGFTTAVLVELPPDGSEARFVNRGHPLPLMLRGDGVVEGVEPPEFAVPLGIESLHPERNRIAVVPFPPDATLLVHTDGVTEARDRAGVFYDPVTALAARVFDGPEALLDAVLADVDAHTRGVPSDDIAMLAIAHARPAAPGGG